MTDDVRESLDQPSEEAIGLAFAATRHPVDEEINKLDIKDRNTDEEGGPDEEFDIDESELPSREGIKPKKTKKKSQSSTNKNSDKETQDGKK